MTEHATFRDRMSIVSEEGKRRWITPKQPSGYYTRLRTLLSLALIAVLAGVPFLRTNGQPFMLFNVVERKFIIFGTMFGPHDFFILGLGIIGAVVFVILFTVVFGRLFCGWVCPQTVFLEMVFRRIDYWIEGDHQAQRRLNAAPWTREKILRKGTKYVLSFAVAFLVSNLLLAWIIGVDELGRIVTDPPSSHLAGLTAMLAFTGVFYWIFVWFREQACILVCPYGRLQGVLLDRHSMVIAYDHRRGEPRAKLRRGEERSAGDCIECNQCVEVCPTGIDIRNGTQLECVNCTACIDACDAVMTKIRRPTGLIRFASAEGIASGAAFRVTPRMIGYFLVLAALVTIVGYLLATRTEVDTTVLRTPGMFYQEQPDGRVSNIYDVKVLNKTFGTLPVTISVEGLAADLRMIGGPLEAGPQGIAEGKAMLILDRTALTAMSTPIAVTSGGRRVGTVQTTFLGPARAR
jgi:cytochrome c oxidase accessory protein FixG